jgi:hypothetical protein
MASVIVIACVNIGSVMPRQAHHSKNWGGKRPGAGNSPGARSGPNKMTAKAIDMAANARIHPFEYLLSVIADKTASTKDRLNASIAAAPYCLSKRATEIHVLNDLDNKSDEELQGRLLTIRRELLEFGTDVIEGELAVNGSGKREAVNGS